MFWSRKQTPIVHDRSRVVGVDLTATRARAVSVGTGRPRTLYLDGPNESLLLFARLDQRTPDIGRTGYGITRLVPHAICSGFLPLLGAHRTWSTGRNSLTAESALQLAFDRVHAPLTHDSDATGLALPGYLSAAQVKKVVEIAGTAKLPLRGTVSMPLAIVASRADMVLGITKAADQEEEVDENGSRPEWVVPLRPQDTGPGTVVVLDADEFALSGAVIGVETQEVKLLASAVWPRLSARLWKERVLDALADRCVRLCRRDPRDSAEAEQSLFEQLDDALERTRHGQPVSLAVRSAHWYQDVPQRAEDFDGYCTALTTLATDSLRELILSASLPVPPRAVWLTPAAGRLPGLVDGIYKASSELTQLAVLSSNAVAEAVAALVPLWTSGALPKSHLDTTIPLTRVPGREAPPASPTHSPHMRAGS
ncbi:MAG: hypothetical protein LC104_08795 [Bacteroidales bacterium]|nr:hypothetical protein [Bacteroidales bacterium]